MRLKISSERQTRWTCELIEELSKKRGLEIKENAIVKAQQKRTKAGVK